MKLTYISCFLLLVFFSACGSNDPNINPGDNLGVIKDGLNYSLEKPNADKALKITFKASPSSDLYGYSGDVYIHPGVISEDTWMYVPASWDTNLAKCKMTKDSANVWSITLSPSIREWFGSGTTPVTSVGIVIRSSDGTKKGIDSDSFVTVTDDKYKGFVAAAVVDKTMPTGLKYGINVVDNSTITLVMYDKDKSGGHKKYVYVVGDFNHWTLSNDAKSQMYRDDTAGCWWITLSGLSATKEYAFQYYIGNTDGTVMRLGDPYCHKILDPSNDSSISTSTYTDDLTYPTGAVGIASVFKIQEDSYNWQVSDYKIADKKDLVIYEMLLRDFTSSGDVEGALAKLDYLKNLGVNAIELMPVQEFDGNDSWGYNPCFYFALDKAYGTSRMYKQFIDKCHQDNIAVIFDVVFNHATTNCPLVKLYWDKTNNKPAGNNPWMNVDAPHPYSVFCDFNHTSTLVRNYFKRNLEYLIDEYHVDGFRFDLAKGFTQTASTEATASNYDASRIANLEYYADAIKAKNSNVMTILELFTDSKEENALANDGIYMWRNLNTAYCQSAMGYTENSNFSNLYESKGNWVGYMESHDEERMAYKQKTWGNYDFKTSNADRMKQLEVNTAFFLTVPGPKMIWQFGELGYDYSTKQSNNTDNDTSKKPVKWDYYSDVDRKALYDTYARLMKLRNDNEDLFDTSSNFTWQVTTTNWDNGRFLVLQNTTKKLVVAGNFANADATISVPFPSTGMWTDYISKGGLSVSSATQSMVIPKHSFKLFVNF